MANEEHLAIPKQGVEAWNKWRRENYKIQPDLRGANLRGANLKSANLSKAILIEANLSHAKLSGADLSNATLSNAKLSYADLRGANLRSAHLSYADLSSADLRGSDLSKAGFSTSDLRGSDLSKADLSGAGLSGTNFSSTHLQDADFTKAISNGNVFADTDLSQAKGLDTVEHSGPSYISIDTLYKSKGQIPESFLRGCGLKDWEIEAVKLYLHDLTPGQASEIVYKIHELRTNPAIQFNSCFISYSSLDHIFSEKLYADLQDKGVRCWFAPEHMKIGDKIRTRIDEAIRLQDKLLLVLSETSIESQWVEQEVETALEKERDQKRTVLCPIMVDKAVMSANASWASFIRNTRHIGDFSGWDNDGNYKKAFNRLLRDLKAEAVKE